jgi:hypothetical protein
VIGDQSPVNSVRTIEGVITVQIGQVVKIVETVQIVNQEEWNSKTVE